MFNFVNPFPIWDTLLSIFPSLKKIFKPILMTHIIQVPDTGPNLLFILLAWSIIVHIDWFHSHNKPSTETHRDHTLYLLLELEHIYKQLLQQSNTWDILYLRFFLFKMYWWQINSYLIKSQNRNSRPFNTITNHSVQRNNHCYILISVYFSTH